MAIPTVFDTCTPRSDVLRGEIAEADFAADLASVVAGKGSAEYRDPVRFFADSYPTRGLKSLLENVCRRLAGAGGEVAAIFRLDTSYGGGKTHGLIALTHAARGLGTVPNISEFIDPSLLPEGRVRVAAFDGENADPANGRTMGDGVPAYTPWGEIASALAGRDGYGQVRKSDETRIAPGAETLRELFGGEPTLILLDELSVYLRKVGRTGDARDQLTAFLTSLFKAVEGAPNAALVYTLAIGKDGRASDAYSEENQFIADQMGEAESVSARKATLLNPTEEDETIQVLRRRLFEHIDTSSIEPAVEGYRALWATHRESLATDAARPESAETFRASYPLHPEVLETLTGKTATLGNFQRVRGMLRLLARTIAHLWEARPADATAIHVHHIDPGHEPIRQEIVTRLQQSAYVPAIGNDIAGDGAEKMVVGPLQPILARLPGTITNTVLADPRMEAPDRACLRDAIERQIDEGESGGFDIDAVLEEDWTTPERSAPAMTMDDLDRVIGAENLMPQGTLVRPLGAGEYALRAPGMTSELRVTTDPDYYEEHTESVEFWSPGNPLFNPPENLHVPNETKGAQQLAKLLDQGPM